MLGSGTVVLSGSNGSFAGEFDVENGTLQVGNSDALGGGSATSADRKRGYA